MIQVPLIIRARRRDLRVTRLCWLHTTAEVRSAPGSMGPAGPWSPWGESEGVARRGALAPRQLHDGVYDRVRHRQKQHSPRPLHECVYDRTRHRQKQHPPTSRDALAAHPKKRAHWAFSPISASLLHFFAKKSPHADQPAAAVVSAAAVPSTLASEAVVSSAAVVSTTASS